MTNLLNHVTSICLRRISAISSNTSGQRCPRRADVMVVLYEIVVGLNDHLTDMGKGVADLF
jgi:hypothetical protein